MPKISVIIPLYNKEQYIGYTIKSVMQQTFDDFECIIIDDYSTDSSLQKCEDYITGDPRFHVVKHIINAGLSASRNTGLLYASGEYIIFLDADDMLSDTCLQERIETLENNKSPHIAGVYSGHRSMDALQEKAPHSTHKAMREVDFLSSVGENPFVVHAPMTRRDVLTGLGGFDESMRSGAEDYDLWLRILRHGFCFIPTHTVNAFYRAVPGSVIRTRCFDHLDQAISIMESAHRALSVADFYSSAHMPIFCSVDEYAKQKKLFSKTLYFFGMTLVEDNNSKLLPYAHYFPDFIKNCPFLFSPLELILSGVKRAIASDDNIDLDKYVVIANRALAELHNNFDESDYDERHNFDNIRTYSPEWQRQIDLVFFPHVRYHVETIFLLAPYLNQAGINFVVADLSAHFVDNGVSELLKNSEFPYVSLQKITMGDFAPAGIVVFNDWEGKIARPAIKSAYDVRIPGIGLVEGIQDYNDVDTGKKRHAYKICSHVITPCPFDMKYFDPLKQRIYQGNIPRVYKLANEQTRYPYCQSGPILINSNFSWGVLTDKRTMFIDTAIEACKNLGLEYTITRHPYDNGDFSNYNLTDLNMYDAIYSSSLFVSRFGSGIIEAIAMNRPVIYYNPHGENVDKFKNSMGAYYIANSKQELIWAIKETFLNLETLKQNWPAFLEEHAGYKKNSPTNSYEDIVKIFQDILYESRRSHPGKAGNYGKTLAKYFKKALINKDSS